MRQPPVDIQQRFGALHDHRYRGNGEHSAACPVCGGARGGNDPSDRFRFWEREGASNFWCRRCGFSGFTDDNQPDQPLDAERIRELEELRKRESAREEARLRAMVEELQQQAYWRGWHDAMTEQQRQLWREAGIPNEFQDYWQLGYLPEKHVGYDGQMYTTPALTIPYFAAGWRAQTVQYRLLLPPATSDKYRFHPGLKSALWMAEPDSELTNAVILCEGMKKAAVVFIEMVARRNGRYTVVSVPSKMPGEHLLGALANADPLYVVLDPDAYSAQHGQKPAVNRLAKMVEAPKRLVKLPCKADDFFTLYGGTPGDFAQYLRLARSV